MRVVPWWPLVPVAIACAGVLFNPILAIFNAHVRPVNIQTVILCEIFIVLAAHAYAILHFNRRMAIWYLYILLIVAFGVLRILATGTPEPKFIRDLMVIPTFVVLGMVTPQRHVIGCILFLQAMVVAGILLEALSLPAYEWLFQVKEYYINSRGMASDEFTNVASGLFVSATRPEARFFPFFDLHRLSSVFLEPVSLGNFMIITVAFTTAFWRLLTVPQQVFMVASIVLTLFASDGRAASISGVLILAAVVVARLMPRNVALVYLPVVAGAVIATVAIGEFKTGTDDFAGRLAHTVYYLDKLELADYLGVSGRFLPEAEDSGIIYLIVTQSLFGLAVMWGLIVIGLPEHTSVHQNYKNGICLYLGLAMMVSFSFVTIKTAAPLWLVYGFLATTRSFAPPRGRSDGGYAAERVGS